MSTSSESVFDVAIVGAGIVGASIAWHLPPRLRVAVLEAEHAPGYHTTGRSAALFTETYGPPGVRMLTRGGRAFYEAPPADFAAVPLLRPRGTLLTGTAQQHHEAQRLAATLRAEGSRAEVLDGAAVRAIVPVLKPHASDIGVFDPEAFDIDVDALLQGFLRGARTRGATLLMNAHVAALTRDASAWHIATGDGRTLRAAIVVNAAGAWVDEVARLAGAAPIGIEPRRRSAFLFQPPSDVDCRAWPAVIALDESWYFKPDAGALLGSPANADLTVPHDVVPEELDIATGIFSIEQATTLVIRRPQRTWAGLRCFVADGEPVCGFDARVPGFFWAAALGGYGIQTAPAFGRLCAALLAGAAVPAELQAQGLSEGLLAPRRVQAGG